MNPINHSHKLEHKGQAIVYSISRLSRKAKLILAGVILLFLAVMFGVGLMLGSSGKNKTGDNQSQGLPPGTNDIEETWVKAQPLTALPSTDLFSVERLTLGTTEAHLAWSEATDQASPTSPFPRNGTYRISYTTNPNDNASWAPVAAVPLGSGQQIQFVKGSGTDTFDHWETPGYDHTTSTANILPKGAKPGDTFYFRAEIKNEKGGWDVVDKAVAKLTIPYPVITLSKSPTYSKGKAWTADTKSAQFASVNPIIKVEWQGNGDDDLAPYTYLYVSTNAGMANKKLATVITDAEGDGHYMSSGDFTVAQAPGTTAYYGIYDAKGGLLSKVFELKTPTQ